LTSAKKHRVLVIDDHIAMQGAMRRLLRNYDVTTCASLAEARGALASSSFAAIVSDVELPDGTGLDLLCELRDSKSAMADRIMFVTGAVHAPLVLAALEASGRPFLGKPFSWPALQEFVAATIEGRRPRGSSMPPRIGGKPPRV
jgi:DNA-binding response OmpR family regulator